jgi:sulfur relay (sulfurtransferase) DsrF/TusC family protein
MKILQVIQSAYRCTVEEQDDPAVWISRALLAAGAEQAVLLRAGAVNYAMQGQDASGLHLGGHPQTQPARLDQDLVALMGSGSDVYVVEEDASLRGLDPECFIAGVQVLPRSGLPKLLAGFQQIWCW